MSTTVSVPGLPSVTPLTGDKVPLTRSSTGLLDSNATVDGIATFTKATLPLSAQTGVYGDLTSKPTLATVATTGGYGDLTGKPTLATVATSGLYGDLTGKPTLAPVATSGLYGDLTGKPTLGTASAITLPGGTSVYMNGAGTFTQPATPVGTTVTATGTLPSSALGAITPVNSASATVQTLPAAAAAFAAMPYGLVVLTQKGTGAPTFAPAGADLLRATSGVAASVQYGMIAAQVISATEWALA